jgi:hypothetical protein
MLRVCNDGRDITDSVIAQKRRAGLGVEILITNRVTELSGRVVDDKGAPVGDATVLVFPADASDGSRTPARSAPTGRISKGNGNSRGFLLATISLWLSSMWKMSRGRIRSS